MEKTPFIVLLVGVLLLFFHFQNEQKLQQRPVDSQIPQQGLLYGQEIEHSFQVFAATAVDGDSIRFLDAIGNRVDLRLASIDAPELRQPYGDFAKSRLRSILASASVLDCYQVDTDRWNRRIVFVVARQSPGGPQLDINATLVAEGLAWHAIKHSDDVLLSQLEQEARFAGRGLWASPDAMSPWDFRAQ